MNKMKRILLILVVGLLLNGLLVSSRNDEPDYLYFAKERVSLNAGDSYQIQIEINDSYPIQNYNLVTNVYIVSFEGNLTVNLAHFPSGTYEGMEQDLKRYQRTVHLNSTSYSYAYLRDMNASIEGEDPISVGIHDFVLEDLNNETLDKILKERDKAWNPFYFNITVFGEGYVTLYFETAGAHRPWPDVIDAPLPVLPVLVSLILVPFRRYIQKNKRKETML